MRCGRFSCKIFRWVQRSVNDRRCCSTKEVQQTTIQQGATTGDGAARSHPLLPSENALEERPTRPQEGLLWFGRAESDPQETVHRPTLAQLCLDICLASLASLSVLRHDPPNRSLTSAVVCSSEKAGVGRARQEHSDTRLCRGTPGPDASRQLTVRDSSDATHTFAPDQEADEF